MESLAALVRVIARRSTALSERAIFRAASFPYLPLRRYLLGDESKLFLLALTLSLFYWTAHSFDNTL